MTENQVCFCSVFRKQAGKTEKKIGVLMQSAGYQIRMGMNLRRQESVSIEGKTQVPE